MEILKNTLKNTLKDSSTVSADLHKVKKTKSRSFQAELFTRFSIAGFALAIIAAFAYSYMASTMISRFYEREGIQATENFAQLSALALLYDSGENAKEAALENSRWQLQVRAGGKHCCVGAHSLGLGVARTAASSHWVDSRGYV